VKLVVNMNLSPNWVTILRNAVHGPGVGAVSARAEDRIVFESDLDFGTLPATSGATTPSVVQLRTGTTSSSRIGILVVRALQQAQTDLLSGRLVTVEDDRVRLRPLTFDVQG
jgi:predicted nuclease of predicted toxin-antitoxin system